MKEYKITTGIILAGGVLSGLAAFIVGGLFGGACFMVACYCLISGAIRCIYDSFRRTPGLFNSWSLLLFLVFVMGINLIKAYNY